MIEFNVNFEELEHMDLDEANKVVSYFDNEDWYEELGATIDGVEYRLIGTTKENISTKM